MKFESHKNLNERLLRRRDVRTAVLFSVLIVLSTALSSCGGNSQSSSSEPDPPAAGNWQVNVSATDGLFTSSQGGFLLQKNGNLSGQFAFSIVVTAGSGSAAVTTTCNSGTATVTGTVSGQTVNLTAVLPTLEKDGLTPTTQTLTLSGGQMSADGSTIQKGTYTLTDGYYLNGTQPAACGSTADTGTWSATSVPALTGGFQGFFHAKSANGLVTGTGNDVGNGDYSVSATFTQGPNIGASSSTITGTLLFQDPVTLLTDNPCLATATVTGTISGNTVVLQIFGSSGTPVGQIGATAANPQIGPSSAVTFDNTSGGYVLHNNNGGPGYTVTTKSCSNGDSGNICLAKGGTNACQVPISLTPPSVTFPPQLLGSAPSSQTVTLTNNTSSKLGFNIALAENDSGTFYQVSHAGSVQFSGGDFNGTANFGEQDNCSQQGTTSLDPGKSCTITISFTPQESCPWLPQTQSSGTNIDGYPPIKCPLPLAASLNVTLSNAEAANTPDSDGAFAIPVTGTGLSAVVPSVSELDFGWEAVGEASPPQTLTFSNQSPNLVTIFPSSQPCVFVNNYTGLGYTPPPVARPPLMNAADGLSLAEAQFLGTKHLLYGQPIQLENQYNNLPLPAPTVGYDCDSDPLATLGGSGQPNFLISNDTCSGQTLQPFGHAGDSCGIEVTFIPQLWTGLNAVASNFGLDDFLQLNTAWCGDANNPPELNCEIDSGRFPVEIKTETPSPLRVTPGAALEFGTVLKGTASAPLTLTLFNDPTDPQTATLTFVSKVLTGNDYLETDNCPATLASNQSCQITVTFTPTISGPDVGQIGLTYTSSVQSQVAQPIYLRGIGQ